jgi:hypothetical protein
VSFELLDKLYPILDLTIKAIAGLMIVLYLHRRNRRHSLKDKFVDVYCDLVDDLSELSSYLHKYWTIQVRKSILDEGNLKTDVTVDDWFEFTSEATGIYLYTTVKRSQTEIYQSCRRNLRKLELLVGRRKHPRPFSDLREGIYQFSYGHFTSYLDKKTALFENPKLRESIPRLSENYHRGFLTTGELLNKLGDLIVTLEQTLHRQLEEDFAQNIESHLTDLRKVIDRY